MEVRNVQEQILDQRRGNNNDERISPSKKSNNSSNNNYSEADIVSRILILEDNIDKNLRAEAAARFEGDTVLRDFIDSIQQTLGKKLEDTVGRMKSLITQKLDEHEMQMDVNIKQILTDVSEEIAFCINEESDRRYEEIQASENRIYDIIGAPRRSTPNIQNNLEQTAARLGSRIQTPEKNISNRSSILREDVSNDSYIPATPPKLELNIPDKLSREEEEKEEEKAAIIMQSIARKRIAVQQVENLRKEQSIESNKTEDVSLTKSPLTIQTSIENNGTSGNSSPVIAGDSSPVIAGNSSPAIAGNSSPVVAGNSSPIVAGNSSPVVAGNSSPR